MNCGGCKIGQYHNPSPGVCQQCPAFEGIGEFSKWLRDMKLGDKVAAMTSAAGIKPCPSCPKRQQFMNAHPIACFLVLLLILAVIVTFAALFTEIGGK